MSLRGNQGNSNSSQGEVKCSGAILAQIESCHVMVSVWNAAER